MEISFGSNDLPASASFNQRLAYKNNYPAGINEYRTLDFWYDDMLYGRVDTQGDTIYPSEARLKQLKTDGNESLFALDFVVDAYNGFIGAMQQQENNGNFILLDGSVFASRFTAVRGWYNINEKYAAYMKFYYDNNIFPYMTDESRTDEIVDFDDFIEVFTRLIEETTINSPFTRTELITSKYSSPHSSGLSIEFAESDHGEDFIKALGYMNNINFELYRETARQHGFSVDKNAPWRLTADVGSNRMQAYMKRYDVSFETFFDKYFYKSHLLDIATMKAYIFQFYEFFVQSFPDATVPLVENVGGKSISLTKRMPRATMSQVEYRERYDNLFWIRLYIYVRAKETNRKWDQHKFDQTVKKASDFFVYSGEAALFKFINKEVKRAPGEFFREEEPRRGTFRFRRKRG
jgi:hypothetical protein